MKARKSVHYRLCIEGMMFHPTNFKTARQAKKAARIEYRERKKDRHDEYWRKVSIQVERVETKITIIKHIDQ